MAEQGLFVKFNPEKISLVAAKLESQHKRLLQSLANIRKYASNLKNDWQGDSADLYIQEITTLQDQGEELATFLLSFSYDLAKVAGVYVAGEGQAKKKAEALPTDGVFRV